MHEKKLLRENDVDNSSTNKGQLNIYIHDFDNRFAKMTIFFFAVSIIETRASHIYQFVKFVCVCVSNIDETTTTQNGIHSKVDNEQPSSKQPTKMSRNEKHEAKKSILILIAIFLTSLIAMFYLYLMFPQLDE